MKGSLSHELEADLPASDVWAVYGSVRLAELVTELLPNMLASVKVEEGNGGVGTVLYAAYPAGAPGPQFQREKLVKIDNEQRVSEAKVIEGGYLERGFISCLFRFEIVEKSGSTSMIRSTFEYEVRDEDVSSAVALIEISSCATVAQTIVGYLTKKKVELELCCVG